MTTDPTPREVAEIAERFMLLAIQEWGQPNSERAQSTAMYLRAAGFDVEISGFPAMGGIVTYIAGKDGDAAKEWLSRTLCQFARGEFNSECRQLTEAATQSREERKAGPQQ